jgi:Protein of unknown function (DUF2924)
VSGAGCIGRPADAALAQPHDPSDHLQGPGEAARRPLRVVHAQAGAPDRRSRGKRRTRVRAADFFEGRHAACARVEWVTHTILVHADGIEWRGRRYRSLSVVALEITGAHWSGPRFSGLRRRQQASISNTEEGDVAHWSSMTCWRSSGAGGRSAYARSCIAAFCRSSISPEKSTGRAHRSTPRPFPPVDGAQ